MNGGMESYSRKKVFVGMRKGERAKGKRQRRKAKGK